jgi:translation initiation factor 1
MKSGKETAGLVYSTDGGRMCPACRKPVGQCMCGKGKPGPMTDGIVRVSRETKGRNGKGVTVVRGLDLDEAGLALLGRELRTACGSGGTVKDGVIEVQGDHRERIIEILTRRLDAVEIKQVK